VLRVSTDAVVFLEDLPIADFPTADLPEVVLMVFGRRTGEAGKGSVLESLSSNRGRLVFRSPMDSTETEREVWTSEYERMTRTALSIL